jgi:hypothetical protein
MLPIFQKKFVQELRDFSAASGEGCRSKRRRRRAFILTIPDISEGPRWSLKRVIMIAPP